MGGEFHRHGPRQRRGARLSQPYKAASLARARGPAIEQILMIRPVPRAIMAGTSARVRA